MHIWSVPISRMPFGFAFSSPTICLGERSIFFVWLDSSQPITLSLCPDQVSPVIEQVARQQEASQWEDEEAQIDLLRGKICQCMLYNLLYVYTTWLCVCVCAPYPVRISIQVSQHQYEQWLLKQGESSTDHWLHACQCSKVVGWIPTVRWEIEMIHNHQIKSKGKQCLNSQLTHSIPATPEDQVPIPHSCGMYVSTCTQVLYLKQTFEVLVV